MKISVIIPTYNRPHLLPRALESVASQAHSDVEVIVVDDASTHGIEAIVAKYASRLPGLIFIRHDTNKGVNAARNTALQRATGELICFLDDDDEYIPHALHVIEHTAEQYPEADIFYFNVEARLKNRHEVRGYQFKENEIVYWPSYEEHLFKIGRYGDAHVVIRKRVFEKTGLRFPEWVNGFESFFYNLLAKEGFRYVYVEKSVSIMHFEHDDHLGYQYAKYPKQYLYGLDQMLKEHAALYAKHKDKKRALLFSLARLAFRSGEIAQAGVYGVRALFSSVA
jgi:glycosyltransferase involved in cell wall biosynthesis